MTKLSDHLRSLRTVPANVGSLMQACEDAAKALDACEVALRKSVRDLKTVSPSFGCAYTSIQDAERAIKLLEDDHAT